MYRWHPAGVSVLRSVLVPAECSAGVPPADFAFLRAFRRPVLWEATGEGLFFRTIRKSDLFDFERLARISNRF
jgi:hypothetical protein